MPKKMTHRLTLALGALYLSGQKQGGYQPSTRGGKQYAKMQLELDTRKQLFYSKPNVQIDCHLNELSEASDKLEASMERMRTVKWGSTITKQQRELQVVE